MPDSRIQVGKKEREIVYDTIKKVGWRSLFSTVSIMNLLETAYRNDKQVENAEKVSDKADELVEQVDRETSPACMLLVSLARIKTRPSSTVPNDEASEKRRQVEKVKLEQCARKNQLEWEIEIKREALERHQKELQAVNAEVIKRRQELRDEIYEELELVDKGKEEYHDSTTSGQWDIKQSLLL